MTKALGSWEEWEDAELEGGPRDRRDTEPPASLKSAVCASSTSSANWTLVQVFGGGGSCRADTPAVFLRQRTWRLVNGETLLRRESETYVDDPTVSRRHARLTCEADRVFVADLSSTNGVFVNGCCITSGTVLEIGDVLRAGDSLFVLQFGNPMVPHEDVAERLARSTLPVLIEAETGTGKEVLARLIHEKSERPGQFVPVNCATLSSSLAESDLFGHMRGAFSGAVERRGGLFLRANRGTLFLDELADLSQLIQSKLLRVLETQRFLPVGGDDEIAVDVRIIGASPVSIAAAVEARSFRLDLQQRLAGRTISLPALRTCRARILPLFVELALEHDARFRLTIDAAEQLLLYPWPGNVRELKMLAHRVAEDIAEEDETGARLLDLPRLDAGFGRGACISRRAPGAPPERVRAPSPIASIRQKRPSRCELARVLEECDGNVARAARKLGRCRQLVHQWINEYGLKARGRQ